MRASSNVFASVATALLFVSAANAYSVLQPTNSTGWTVGGPNTFSWTRVSTDPQNFTIVLDNQSVFPQYQQILDALVDGSQNPASITVNPPSGGFVAGTSYRVNVVTDSQDLNDILVQSDFFTIKAGGSSSSVSASSSGSALTSGPATVLSVPPSTQDTTSAPGGTSPASGSGAPNPTTSDTSLSPSQTSNAQSHGAIGAQTVLFGALVLLGAFLA